jgi:hypothetical protein
MKYFLQTMMYLCLIFSFLFLIVGLRFSESAVQEASAAGFACFFGIMTRIIQSEIHNIKNVKDCECGTECDCQNCKCIS